MKRWALLFVRKNGVPTDPAMVWARLDQEHAEDICRCLNSDYEITANGLYYAVETEDE